MKNLSILLIAVLLFSCNDSNKIYSRKIPSISGKTMGTYYSVKIDEKKVDLKQLKDEVEKMLKALDKTFSTYQKDSELNRLNEQSHKLKTKVTKDMRTVLELSKLIYFNSRGAFDPTIGPLVNLWGFGPEKDLTRPEAADIKAEMAHVGAKKFNITDGYFTKKIPNLYLDLSGIAKGHAVDVIAKYLKYVKGYNNILVEIGGEVRGFGFKNKAVWAIGIEKPSPGGSLGSSIQKVIPLLNKSIATSGSYRNYLRFGDKVFSHTIDPTTGFPVQHKLVSVSVIDKDCAFADAWATALMVMGPEKGFKMAEKEGLMAFFLVKKSNSFEELTTEKLTHYLNAIEGK